MNKQTSLKYVLNQKIKYIFTNPDHEHITETERSEVLHIKPKLGCL